MTRSFADTITALHRTLHRALTWVVLSPVMFYRNVLSPMKRQPTCRFLPTCSEYALDAVKHRGIVVGSVLAAWRVLRCNPLFKSGYDPVPRRAARCDHDRTRLATAGHDHGQVHAQEHR
ncbi:MAG: membrane protein insertion efficiency factor YidD [Proteobacteria bacterium]|nr:membrane protein insertion efficiency factor YidD [Pseudomonadota bacterium]